MTQLRKIAKKAYREVLILRAQSKLQAMAAGNESSRLLSEALRETFARQLAAEESKYVEQIEALRRRLDISQEQIEIIDYGAGNTNEVRTESQMQQGTVHHVTVGEMSQISKYEIWVLMLFKLIRSSIH